MPSAVKEVPESETTEANEPEAKVYAGLGRGDGYLKQSRVSSGGLSDDPTESGAPVIDPTPFTKLKG